MSFSKALSNDGHVELYIGEQRLPNDMSILQVCVFVIVDYGLMQFFRPFVNMRYQMSMMMTEWRLSHPAFG